VIPAKIALVSENPPKLFVLQESVQRGTVGEMIMTGIFESH
jgi:hypothetical protein